MMILFRKIFITLALFAVVIYCVPQSGYSRIVTNVNPDISADQLKAFVIEDFEDSSKLEGEDGWRLTTVPPVLKDPNKKDKNPVAVLEHKIIPGRPSDMRPDEWSHNRLGIKNNEIDRVQKVYGLRFRFRYPGYNSVHIEPPVNPQLSPSDEPNKKIRGIILPGKAKGISMWVHSRGHPYYLDCWIEDYENRVYILKMGKIDYVGWRPMKAYIPINIPQEVDTYPQTKFLKIVRFVLRADPNASVKDDVYVFFDQLKVLTDDFEVNFDGQDLDKLFHGQSQKSSTQPTK
ncbi:MAG: flagellar filament outer layer protein FlaA [Spirochaetes bacterium]|nr:flagellar filament outer layer protein FlaA [Spirochaetota bacterium]